MADTSAPTPVAPELQLVLACFDPPSAIDRALVQVAIVDPTVSYSDGERPQEKWKGALKFIIENLPSGPIRVKGRAPQAVYAWAGALSGAGRELRLEQGGFTFVLPEHVADKSMDTCTISMSVVGGEGAHLLFVNSGHPDRQITEGDRKAIEQATGQKIASVDTVQLPSGVIGPEQYTQVIGELAKELRVLVDLARPGQPPFIFLTTAPCCVAAAVGRILRLAPNKVLMLERRVDQTYTVYTL